MGGIGQGREVCAIFRDKCFLMLGVLATVQSSAKQCEAVQIARQTKSFAANAMQDVRRNPGASSSCSSEASWIIHNSMLSKGVWGMLHQWGMQGLATIFLWV